jgi:hypothetical protein
LTVGGFEEEFAYMSMLQQLASASLTGAFAALLFLASHGFAEYRAAKQPVFLGIDVTQRSSR